MSDSDSDCDHDCFAFPSPGGIGIPRLGQFNADAFEKAISDLLLACGVAPDSAHTGKTAQRVRALWEKRLLGGYDLDHGVREVASTGGGKVSEGPRDAE